MRTYTIGAAATLALVAVLGACSDGSNLLGAAGSTGNPTPMAGSGPVGAAGSDTTPGAGSGNSQSYAGAGGSLPAGGSAPVAGSGDTSPGGSGGSVSGGAPGSAGATTGGSAGAVAMGGSGGGGGDALETGAFKALIVSTHLEYEHPSIKDCQKLIADLGKLDAANTWTTTIETDDLPHFTDAGLKEFRLLVFCSPTGTVFSGNPKVKDKAGAMKAFQTFIEGGGGYVGVHSASDFEKTNGFPWYTNTLMGGYFTTHDNYPTQGTVTVDATGTSSPIMKGLKATYSTQDEWYFMNRDIAAQPGFKIIQRLSKDNRPLTWVKTIVSGRMFYTSRGHDSSTYPDTEFRTLVQNGILWTTKRVN